MTEEVNPSAETQTTDSAGPAPQDTTIPYARFQEVLQERNALRKDFGDLQGRLKKIEEDRLRAQEDWKALAETAKSEASQAQREAESARAALLRYQVGSELGVPAAFIDRLRGDDADSIRADAEAFLAAIPKPQAPSTDAGQPRQTTPKKPLKKAEMQVVEALRDVYPGLTPEEYSKYKQE